MCHIRGNNPCVELFGSDETKLQSELARRIDWQTAASQRICREYGVDFVDVAHAELVSDFWATDGFHPSASGYEQASGLVIQAMSFLPEMAATIR